MDQAHFAADEGVSNDSPNATFADILSTDIARRRLLQGSLGAAALGFVPGMAAAATARPSVKLGFKAVPVSTADAVAVPEGYNVDLLYAWGDPISSGPAFKADGSGSAADQERQAGMHHDGMSYFPLGKGSEGSTHGLLVMNHEYTDDGLLHADGMKTWSAEKVRKAQAAHGVSVIEVLAAGNRWKVVRPSPYARRVTASSPIGISGPAAGHALLQTKDDPRGLRAFGTFNNCANGQTPWGTYLTCEENFNGYFSSAKEPTADEKRYGLKQGGAGYRWHEFDERFDSAKHPNEPNRFGWVVEIDPLRPDSLPQKRTALGRFKHEGADVQIAKNGHIVVYMGDDERFEYIYKFVSENKFDRQHPEANRHLLDRGTLYVAKFDEFGGGVWLPLVHGEGKLTAENGFPDQGAVLIRCRQAADAVGATKMDRPEWIATHPKTGEVYCALTNNSLRADEKNPGTLNASNPRAKNVFGHIIRWREAKGDATAKKFEWDIFVLAGDPKHPDEAQRGNIKGDVFGSPDGLWFDKTGRLWIQTDVSTSVINKGDYANIGNNQMLVADTVTREIRRFLTGPSGCEVTGIAGTPDGKTLFVNIQHPGESPSERADPEKPTAFGAWPASQFGATLGGRPRSGTVVIRREDGGVVGG
ncbi:MAG: PhoX family phosphatase [Moraxellaceae bacterium]|nr:PhoX family phosphatase [Moraxellaceae bacterium]